MIDGLATLLMPMADTLGISPADLLNYLAMIEGYIWALIAAIVLLIAIMFLAHLLPRGRRHIVRWQAVLAFVLAGAVIVNGVCYGPLYNNVSGFLNASAVQLADDVVAQSNEVIEKTGEEGLVLVKNDGLLPLGESVKRMNVFGWASISPLFGGVGSGSSDGSEAVGILQSLRNAGYELNQSLEALYMEYRADRPVISGSAQDWTLPEPPVENYTQELMADATAFSDVAMIVIGRSGGEGADLPKDMKAVIDGSYNIKEAVSVLPNNYRYTNASYTNNGNYDDFASGESYLELSRTEEALVDMVCANFAHVIVVINANNVMELGWVDTYPQIRAVILAPGTGNTGMQALGRVISGEINPSGRTVDTYAYDLATNPTFNHTGNFAYANVDDLKAAIAASDSSYEGNISFLNYAEGIYVGYKFYETAAQEGLIDYDAVVQYPFGYGLSYTSFEQKITEYREVDAAISLKVKVTNTGKVAGKEVVQVYYRPPYTNGGIEKSAVCLIDFAKTKLLKPGESQVLSFAINKEDMASYDSNCHKTENGGYILEAGEYQVWIGANAHTVLDSVSFSIASDIDYSESGRSDDLVAATNHFQDYTRGDVVYLSRADGFANYAQAVAAPADDAYLMDAETRAQVEMRSTAYYDPKLNDRESDEMPDKNAENGLALADMVGKDYDDPDWELLLDQMSFSELTKLVNVGGWQTIEVESIGKCATSDCDGPAGLNNLITKATGTAYPTEVLMAQTWNKELLYDIGVALGSEFAAANNYGWYGPGMNLHRSAFGGRNYEYYSEDGVLSGILAEQEIRGAQSLGVYTYVKHFALNDQECNRCAFLLTYADEQAMRENYLKPFEYAVKRGGTKAVMSSYNWLGAVPCCANSDLLVEVLRNEWGFQGMVISDYAGSYGYMITDHCVRNGNDLMLGFWKAQSTKFTDRSATVTLALRQASKNILYTIANSGYYMDSADAQQLGVSRMDKLFIMADTGIALGVVFVELVLLLRRNRKRKKDTQTA